MRVPWGRKYYEPFTQDQAGVIRNPVGEIVGQIEVASPIMDEAGEMIGAILSEPTAAVDEPLPGPRAIAFDTPGTYLLLEDVTAILRALAAEYEQAGNPSASLALREVADAWTP